MARGRRCLIFLAHCRESCSHAPINSRCGTRMQTLIESSAGRTPAAPSSFTCSTPRRGTSWPWTPSKHAFSAYSMRMMSWTACRSKRWQTCRQRTLRLLWCAFAILKWKSCSRRLTSQYLEMMNRSGVIQSLPQTLSNTTWFRKRLSRRRLWSRRRRSRNRLPRSSESAHL